MFDVFITDRASQGESAPENTRWVSSCTYRPTPNSSFTCIFHKGPVLDSTEIGYMPSAALVHGHTSQASISHQRWVCFDPICIHQTLEKDFLIFRTLSRRTGPLFTRNESAQKSVLPSSLEEQRTPIETRYRFERPQGYLLALATPLFVHTWPSCLWTEILFSTKIVYLWHTPYILWNFA